MTPKPTTPTTLIVLLQGQPAGIVTHATPQIATTFTYDDAWRADPDAFPLSLALPLAGRTFAGVPVERYLRGLLTDDSARLRRLAAQFGVDATDAYALLAQLGEDCPGAVQFVRPERLETLQRAAPEHIDWLTADAFAAQIDALVAENGGVPPAEEEGQFSLPGAQAKVALRWDPDRARWGRPLGRTASTHIIKPPRPQIPFHCENEHLCLELARALGLTAAESTVLRIGKQRKALVVSRYDRVRTADGEVQRLHQEDFSQGLGADPALKYAAEGAPTLAQMVTLLRDWAADGTEEALRLVEAVAFNWIIAGTDAHPRNYSLLIRSGSDVTLAPLYDVASALFLRRSGAPRSPAGSWKLAMAVAGETRVGAIGRTHWETEAKESGLRASVVVDRITRLATAVPLAVAEVRDAALAAGIDEQFAMRFARDVTAQAQRAARALSTR
jgi:serine/threonine-protein kinase HipA